MIRSRTNRKKVKQYIYNNVVVISAHSNENIIARSYGLQLWQNIRLKHLYYSSKKKKKI